MKKIALILLALVVSSCATTGLTPDNIQGTTPGKPFTDQNFIEGKVRFSKIDIPASRIFSWGIKIDNAFARSDYDKVLSILSEKDSGNDVHYYYLGVIAEDRGYLQAADAYYRESRTMYNSHQYPAAWCYTEDNTQPSKKLFSDELDWDYYYETTVFTTNPCFKLNLLSVLNDSINRISNKINGTYEELNLEYDDGSIYFGASNSEDIPTGQGILFYSNGDVYKGNFENFLPSGKGSLVFDNGWLFDGEFKNGLPIVGTLSNPSDLFYRPMKSKDGDTFTYINGDPLGSRPLDNNWWFADSVSGAFMNTTRLYAGISSEESLRAEMTKSRKVSGYCKNKSVKDGDIYSKKKECYSKVRDSLSGPVFSSD